jgi:heme exporter protein A
MQFKSPATIKVEKLGFSRSLVPIFQSVNFQLEPGRILMVRGGNGSGKTTLLRVLAGFSRPETGTISSMYARQDWQSGISAEQIGWLGHNNGIKDDLSAIENLAFWKHSSQDKSSLEATLKRVEIYPVRNQSVRTLSAGQKRRLALARLLLSNRPVWLMDEPSANLDRDGTRLIESLLQEHTAKNGSAIVASHDPLHPDAPTEFIKLLSGGDV